MEQGSHLRNANLYTEPLWEPHFNQQISLVIFKIQYKLYFFYAVIFFLNF